MEHAAEGRDDGHDQGMVSRPVAFGFSLSAARELAGERDVEMITGWLDYARRARELTNPPAFVVSRLRAGEPVPESATPQSTEEDRQRYLEWAQGRDTSRSSKAEEKMRELVMPKAGPKAGQVGHPKEPLVQKWRRP